MPVSAIAASDEKADSEFAKSNSEVRKNKPELVKTLDDLDCIDVKWGKKRLYIIVGE